MITANAPPGSPMFMGSAIKLVERFIASVIKPARPSTPEAETNPAPAAEPVAASPDTAQSPCWR